MKIQELTIGLSVRHPQYGIGIVKSVNEQTTDILFNDMTRTMEPNLSGIAPAEATMAIGGLAMPLKEFVSSTVQATINKLGLEHPDSNIEQLGTRWHRGKLVLHPADATLQTKEVPLEVFFHKVVGVRNQLRVLEQKINAHEQLTDGDKVEMQQYITRCYGSLTTFNVLFKNKEDLF
jgi:hypothetical protein